MDPTTNLVVPLSVVVLAGPEVRDPESTLRALAFASRTIVLARDGDSARAFRQAGAERVTEFTASASEMSRTEVESLPEQLFPGAEDGWLLFIEAEERLSLELRDEIIACLQSAAASGTQFQAYAVQITRYQCGVYLRHGGWLTKQTRLLRSSARRGLVKRPSEGSPSSGGIGHLRHLMVDLGHRTIGDRLRWINRASEIDKTSAGGVGLLRLAFEPLALFLRIWVLRSGFRDRVPGLVAASLAALHHFLNLAKSWENNQLERTSSP